MKDTNEFTGIKISPNFIVPSLVTKLSGHMVALSSTPPESGKFITIVVYAGQIFSHDCCMKNGELMVANYDYGDLEWEVLGLAKNAEILGYIRLV